MWVPSRVLSRVGVCACACACDNVYVVTCACPCAGHCARSACSSARAFVLVLIVGHMYVGIQLFQVIAG